MSLKTAKKAISDYKKATKNIKGTIDLMIYYVECGTKFTCTFEDIDENFYYSLETMFDNLLELMKKQPYCEEFNYRIEEVVKSAKGIGWGYYDKIKYTWDEWQLNNN